MASVCIGTRFPTVAVVAADPAAIRKRSGGNSVNTACPRGLSARARATRSLPRPAGEFVVEVDDAGGDQRPTVVGAAVLVGVVAAPLPLLRVGGGSQKRLCERVLVVGGNEPAGSWGDELGGPVRVGGNHGQAAGHRFDEDEPE